MPSFSPARRAFLHLFLALGVLSLAACGGGDDSDSLSIESLTYSPAAPSSGTPVALNATVAYASTLSASSISVAWTQTSGPTVSITGASSTQAYFTAPTVSADTDIVLKLTVSSGNLSTSKSVTITVSP